jgi:phage regulator Rha-like protein
MGDLMIVEQLNGEARVSSKVIAENVENSHKAVSQLIKKHLTHIEEFGKVEFEMRPLESGQRESIYFLNEDQSTFLLTCMKNTDIVIHFKKNLVKAFSSLKKIIKEEMVKSILSFEEELRIHQMTASFLNMSDNGKLGMMQKFYESKGLDVKMLPNYTESKGTLKSASELLKENGCGISAIAFNKLMVAEGLIVERTRPSTKHADKVKTFKALSDEALIYGENMQSPQNPKEVQPMYYAEKFVELCKKLGVK